MHRGADPDHADAVVAAISISGSTAQVNAENVGELAEENDRHCPSDLKRVGTYNIN